MGRRYADKDLRLLYLHSGNLCAFPGCEQKLTEPATDSDDPANLSDIAHIVAESRQGPRGTCLLSAEDRNKYPNLILLCKKHHKIIDDQPRTYSVRVLQQMKQDHEARVAALASTITRIEQPHVQEVLHSTVLPVTHLPKYVYTSPCKYGDDEDAVKQELEYPRFSDRTLVPFCCRDKKVITFFDLKDPDSPFRKVINFRQANRIPSAELWATPEGHRRFVLLLNRSLFKYTSEFAIRFDPVHRRFYFPVIESGKERVQKYRPLNIAESERKVAWNPRKRATGEARGFWWHLAASLCFVRAADRQWYLSIRPERHLTADGETPLAPDKVGPRVTRLKARMYNDKYLTEVQFWRDVLCRGTPRIIFNYGAQSLIINSILKTLEVEWPGIPEDAKPFKNQAYDDDLFSLADFDNALAADDEEDDSDDEEDVGA